MRRARHDRRLAAVLALAIAVALCATAPRASHAQLRPHPEALAAAPPELLDRVRGDAYSYFRFINRAWTARVCEAFADTQDVPIVRLHGDAHVEQFAVTDDAWGLDDFDDSARGAMYVDIVRFLASIDLAARQRGWAARRAALQERFVDGLRRGLKERDYRPPEPAVVRVARARMPATNAGFLKWGERLMRPLSADESRLMLDGVGTLDRWIRGEGRSFAPGYFTVVRAGRIRLGVGSSAARKVLIRVRGPTADPDDDVLLEGKEVANLDGLSCLEDAPPPPALRIIDGARQLGRLKHDILAVGPALLRPGVTHAEDRWLEWWVSSWEPSYRELRVADLRSPEDLAGIAFDSGVQLAAGAPADAADRAKVLTAIDALEPRIRNVTARLVDELLAGWRELSGRRATSEAAR